MRVTPKSGEFEHFLLTRFNVRVDAVSPPPTEEWLRHRLDLFRRYALPSVANQTVNPHQWLVLCDGGSPDWLRRELCGQLPDCAEVVWLAEPFSGDVVAREVDSRRQGAGHLITTRMDNDDCVARDFMSAIQEQFVEQDREFINFTRGGQVRDGCVYQRLDPSNAFISLIEAVDPGQVPMTVFVAWHDRLRQYGPVRQIKTHPMWLQVVHYANLANSVHGIRVQPDSVMQHFDVQLGLDPSTRQEIMLDRAKTAVALSVRVIRKPHRIVWLWRSIRTSKKG